MKEETIEARPTLGFQEYHHTLSGASQASPDPIPLQVSVVIPTQGSRYELLEAVQSILADDAANVTKEIIVIVDGVHSDVTLHAASLDLRVRVVTTPLSMGAAFCRMEGIRRASGQIVAFLDDDDLWLPGRAQALQKHAGKSNIVIASYVRRRTKHGVDIVPHRPPAHDEHLSEFLFRRGFRYRASFLQTSGLAASRDVALAVGFPPLLSRHQDYFFLLQAVYGHGATFVFVDQVLGEWRLEQPRGTSFRTPSWRTSRAWCLSNPVLFSSRGRGSFLASVVNQAAADDGHRWIALRCAVESVVRGRPSISELIVAFCRPFRGKRVHL